MRSRIVGGTTRPAAGAEADGWVSASLADSTSGAAVSAASAEVSADSATSPWGTSAPASTGTGSSGATLAVFTSRGGGNAGATGLAGSGAFLAVAPFLPFDGGVSARMLPFGSAIFRCRATRSMNCRATTSSMVLEALFTSMP